MLAETIVGLQHLGLPVTDLARSEAFYTRLGFTPVMRADLPEGDDAIHVVMLELNGLVLELYQLVGAERAAIAARQDGHIDHIALDVRDVDAAFEAARAAGLEPIEAEPVFLPFWDKGVRYFNVRGPDGERVEFNQRLR